MNVSRQTSRRRGYYADPRGAHRPQTDRRRHRSGARGGVPRGAVRRGRRHPDRPRPGAPGDAPARAHGTSLAAIVPIAASGIAGFWIEGSVDWPAAGLLAAGSAAGALAGTTVLQHLEGRALRLLFAGLLVVTAVRLLIETPSRSGRGDLDPLMLAGLLALGVFAGVVAGLFGVGGGVVTVPALVLLFAVPDPIAKGTSLVVILPTAIVGTWRNVRYGNADLRVAAATGISGVVSAFGASLLAVRLEPQLSATLFGALLVVVAIRLVVVERRRTVGRRPARRP